MVKYFTHLEFSDKHPKGYKLRRVLKPTNIPETSSKEEAKELREKSLVRIAKEDLAKPSDLVVISTGNFIKADREDLPNPKRQFLIYFTKDPIVPYMR